MKGLDLIKKLVIITISILVAAVAFFGVYGREKGVWLSKLKDYNYGMDFKGYRELRFVLDDSEETEKKYYVDDNGNIKGEVKEEDQSLTGDTEINLVDDSGNPIETDDINAKNESENSENKEDDPTSAYKIEARMVSPNPAEMRTQENYKKTKKIMQDRLEKTNGYEYHFRMDDETGDIVLEVPDDNDTVVIQESLMTTKGNFKIVDSENGLILLDSDSIESAQAYPFQNQVYLIVQYKGDAINKLNEISKTYVAQASTDNESEEADATGSTGTNSKNVDIMMDDTKLSTTYFGYEIKDGMLQLAMGQEAEDEEELLNSIKQVSALADTVAGESLPLEYKLSSDNYIKSKVTLDSKKNVKLFIAIMIVLASAVLIIKYNKNGLVLAAIGILYSGLLALSIRYTNVFITFNSVVTYLMCLILNYVLLFKIARKNRAEAIKEYYWMTIPVWCVGIVFTFAKAMDISSIGMVSFWGMFIQLITAGLTALFL